MSYNDMASHLQEIYGLEISNATLSTITDKIIHTVKEWQASRWKMCTQSYGLMPHYKVRENGKVGSKAVYTILGVNIENAKRFLGCTWSENEGANFWLQVLTQTFQNRGVKDILIASC
ncbi:MAG: transposase [Desulfobacter sp.]|nr:transposase [Desulfobacter sp.]